MLKNGLSIEGVLNFEPIGVFEFAEYPEQKLFLTPFLEMLNYCYENQFTQIHTATPGPLGLAALAIGKFLKIPVSGTYHTAIPQYAHRLTGDGAIEDLVWKYIIWFYDQLDFILVPSNSTGDELIGKGINPEKIRLFPRGVDTQKFNPSKRNTALLSGSVGRRSGFKNPLCRQDIKREGPSSPGTRFQEFDKEGRKCRADSGRRRALPE